MDLRQARKKDYNFLYLLKKKTLKDYINQTWGWEEEWQKQYFAKHFNPEDLQIITDLDQDIGVISLIERENELDISLIEILPEFQNKGIGGSLLKKIIKKAISEKKRLSLQVLKVNTKAISLYKKLGFLIEGQNDTHYFMVYKMKKLNTKS